MMTTRAFFMTLFMTLAFSLNAMADLNLDSPKKLLARASEGRIPLREVILDMQQNYPEMRDPVIFESYFYMLDDLKKLAVKFNLDEIFPQAVEKLGSRLAGHGLKWLSIGHHSTEKILYYQRWMTADEATVFCDMMDFEVKNLEKESEYRLAAANLDAIIVWFKQRYPDRRDLHLVAYRIITDIANLFLKQEDISEADVQFWLGKIAIASGFSEYIEYIQQNIYEVTDDNVADLHSYLRRLVIIQKRYLEILQKPPYWITSLMGDTGLELASKMIFFEEDFHGVEFEDMLKLLSSRHLKTLATLFTTADHLPTQKYAKTYLRITQIMIESLRKQGLTREAYDLSLFVSRIGAALVTAQRNLEGTYNLVDNNGKNWTFTFTQVNESTIYAAVSDESRQVFHSFLNITYNVKTGEFIASDIELTTADTVIQPLIRFKFTEDGTVVLENLGADQKFRWLKGTKTQSYPNLFQQNKELDEAIEGEFAGTMSFPDGKAYEVRLLLSHMNGRTVGRLLDKNGLIFDITISNSGANNVLYLATGRLKSAAYAHIRLIQEGTDLRGYIITGGRGISPEPFVLKKIRRAQR